MKDPVVKKKSEGIFLSPPLRGTLQFLIRTFCFFLNNVKKSKKVLFLHFIRNDSNKMLRFTKNVATRKKRALFTEHGHRFLKVVPFSNTFLT